MVRHRLDGYLDNDKKILHVLRDIGGGGGGLDRKEERRELLFSFK